MYFIDEESNIWTIYCNCLCLAAILLENVRNDSNITGEEELKFCDADAQNEMQGMLH